MHSQMLVWISVNIKDRDYEFFSENFFCMFVVFVSDGELYTGTVSDFRGTRPVISRHLSEGSHVDLKLDDTLGWLEGKKNCCQKSKTKDGLYWLCLMASRNMHYFLSYAISDPTFISSTYIHSEEKVYFFFSEIGKEYDFIDKFTVSRVAQVCTVSVA